MPDLHAVSTCEESALARITDDGAYPIRVAFDGTALLSVDGGTGKGAQLRTLLDGVGSSLIGLAPRSRSNAVKYEAPAAQGIQIIQGGPSRYLIWQQTGLPRLLADLKPNVFLAPYNTAPLRIPKATKLVSVVHDLILLEGLSDSTWKQRAIDRYRAMLMDKGITRSSLVLTVSKFTASHIMQRYPRVRPRVIPCTVGESWYVRGRNIPSAQREPYILLVTNFRAHKNAPRAMEAFARYRARDPKSSIKLRMVGVSHERATVNATIERLGLSPDSVVVEPFLNEVELQGIYRQATCVMIPSRMEGFGIPALEAMASGTPLLCSNAWSLPEVGGDAPLYFDPLDVEAMTEAIFCVCNTPALRQSLIERGLRRAEVFHPDCIREQVKSFWDELPDLYKSWTSKQTDRE